MTRTVCFPRRLTPWLAGAALSIATLATAAQQPTVVVHDDDITIRGCVGRVQPGSIGNCADARLDARRHHAQQAPTRSARDSLTDRVFYWLDDDEDLSKHVGQMVEVKGDLGDFKKGEVEIDEARRLHRDRAEARWQDREGARANGLARGSAR